jgi:hypothetical protein
MSVGRDNRKKRGRRIIFADRSENLRFKSCPQIKFTDLSSRPARRSSGGPVRRLSGGFIRRFCGGLPAVRLAGLNPNSQISSKKVTGRPEFIGRNKFIAHYLIFHSLGLRFSRKALIPSLASSVADIDTPMLFKYSMALLIGISAAL